MLLIIIYENTYILSLETTYEMNYTLTYNDCL